MTSIKHCALSRQRNTTWVLESLQINDLLHTSTGTYRNLKYFLREFEAMNLLILQHTYVHSYVHIYPCILSTDVHWLIQTKLHRYRIRNNFRIFT